MTNKTPYHCTDCGSEESVTAGVDVSFKGVSPDYDGDFNAFNGQIIDSRITEVICDNCQRDLLEIEEEPLSSGRSIGTGRDMDKGRYDHMLALAFSARSNQQDAEDLTPDAVRDYLMRRIKDLDDSEIMEACLPPLDTIDEGEDSV